MDARDFSEEEWRGILDEFRLLVQRAGYADWDLAMALSIEEQRNGAYRRDESADDQPSLDELRSYVGEFMGFLKSRSGFTLGQQRERLGNILKTDEGQPVHTVEVAFGEERRPLYEHADNIDAMIADLHVFIAVLYGDDNDFWDEPTDNPDRGPEP